jgi:hypothetical protein
MGNTSYSVLKEDLKRSGRKERIKGGTRMEMVHLGLSQT